MIDPRPTNLSPAVRVHSAAPSVLSDYPLPPLFPFHWDEWLRSGVLPEIIAANVRSLSGTAPYDYLLYSDRIERRNDGRVVDWVLRRYHHLEHGGWWCNGINPFLLKQLVDTNRDGLESALDADAAAFLWGCFKPDSPYLTDDGDTLKPIKYEHPPKTPTSIFLLQIPSHPRLWLEALSNPHLPIIIVEGAKKAGCVLSLGYIAIALPGVTGAVRTKNSEGNSIPPYLIEEIAMFACPGRTFYICFDQDTKPTTVANVNREISKLGYLLQSQGCSVRVMGWNATLGKGPDDLVAGQGRDAFDQAYGQALTFSDWLVRSAKTLSHAPNITLNQRYLGKLPIPSDQKLVCIKSPKGTGKTRAIAPIIQEAMQRGQWVLLIGHRVQLVQSICAMVGLPYVTELRQSETGALLGYGLCIDSLHPNSQAHFNAEGWKDGIVIVDEAEQVIWHTLDSDTEIQKHRVEVLQQLKQFFTNVLSSERGQIILSDADLTDLSVEFVNGLAQTAITPWVVVNQWQPSDTLGWQVHHYSQTTPDAWLNALTEAIGAGERPMIVTQSKQDKSRWSALTLELYLQKIYPHKRILRIDSSSVTDPTYPAYGCVPHLALLV